MDILIVSTLVLIAGALLLTLIAAGPALKRHLKARKKECSHEKH